MNTTMENVPIEDHQQSMLPAHTTDDMLIDMWMNSKHSTNTQDAYTRDIKQFLGYVQKPLQAITLMDVQQYQASLQGKPTTIARKMAVVKSLLSFGSKMQYLRFNVGAAIQLPSTPSKLAQRILSEEHTIKMISLENNARNHAILRLLYHCGLRVSELVALSWGNCLPRDHGGQLHIVGKGDKEREVLVEAGMWQELMQLKASATGVAVFSSRRGSRLQRRQIESIVQKAAIKAGIDAAVSPHWLRHCHASHSLDRGAPISLVSATLGHSSIAVTGRYTHARPNSSSGQYLAL